MPLVDDLGHPVPVDPERVRRVVSLVPSLTESVAASVPEGQPGLLVAATDWCSHPAGLWVARVGGTKNPRVREVLASTPDLVLANDEENRAEDVAALRAAGVPVWVTAPRTVPGALDSLARMLAACGLPRPRWLDDAEAAWGDLDGGTPPWAVGVVPIWRRPWMVLGSATFAGDLLRRLGVANALAGHPERYPRVVLDDLLAVVPPGQGEPQPLVVLPDEPYAFGADDGPEAFPGREVRLVSGRHLTWYGPSLVEAPRLLAEQLRAPGVRQL